MAIFLPFAGTGHSQRDAQRCWCMTPRAATALTSLTLPETALKTSKRRFCGRFGAPNGRGNAAFAAAAVVLSRRDGSHAIEQIRILAWKCGFRWPDGTASIKRSAMADGRADRLCGPGGRRETRICRSATDTGHRATRPPLRSDIPRSSSTSRTGRNTPWPSRQKPSSGRSMARCPAARTSMAVQQAVARRSSKPRAFQRFRRHHRRRCGKPKTHLDAWRMVTSLAMFKDAESFIPASKYPAIQQGGARRVRCARWRPRRADRKSAELPLQSRGDAMQGSGRPDCLTAPQVESARVAMSPLKIQRRARRDFPGLRARQRAWMGPASRRARPVRDSTR